MRCVWLTLLPLLSARAAAQGLTSDDRKAIESAALAIAGDRDFRAMVGSSKPAIVLAESSPSKMGFLRAEQMQSDLAPRRLDPALAEALWRRNYRGSNWDSRVVSFKGRISHPRIQVAKVPMGRERGTGMKGLGWFQPYLPAYSLDERFAVVRGFVGPWAHTASATVLLRRDGARWVPEWVRIVRYA
ncbi:MAG TPA: hypothetical protein VGE01_14135 [Fimbriimonas sp.]